MRVTLLFCLLLPCFYVGISPTEYPPEEEFCVWLERRCPLFSSPNRPVRRPRDSVNISLDAAMRTMLNVDDVEQT